MKSKFTKKVITISLCLGLIFSSFGSLSLVIAKDAGFSLDMLSKKKPKGVEDIKGEPSIQTLLKKEYKESTSVPDENQVLYKGSRISMNPGNPLTQDKFRFSEKDIEDLVNSGNSLQDIYKADELGNTINEDPKKLLKRKGKKDWTQVEKDVKDERVQKILEKYKNKLPKEYKQLEKEELTNEGKITLLALVEEDKTENLKDLVVEYKKKGEAFSREKRSKTNIKKTVSKELKDQNGLNDADVVGLTDLDIESFKEIAKKSNKSVKDIANKFKEMNERIKKEAAKK